MCNSIKLPGNRKMKNPIAVDGTKCSGCRTCQLVCSLTNFSVNNPKKSAIHVFGLFPEPRFEAIVCNQCGRCAEVCPEDAIKKKNGVYIIDKKKCTNCGECVRKCPSHAIFVHPDLTTPIKCVLCYKCVKMCPMEAIKPQRKAKVRR
jgi:ferredoxin